MRTAGGVVLSSAGAGRAAEAGTLDLDSLAAWRSSFRSPAPCLRSMVLTLTVLAVCSRQQRERTADVGWERSSTTSPPLL
jgi:hypothetical protein